MYFRPIAVHILLSHHEVYKEHEVFGVEMLIPALDMNHIEIV